METKKQQTMTKEIVLTLDGDLMVGGSIDYKTLFDVIEGSIGAIEGFSRVANFNQAVSYRLKPPKENCFEISIQAVQLLGTAVPLLQTAGTISDVVSFFIEYLKIVKALKGEGLRKENVQTNNNGDVIVENNTGDIVYHDNRKIINYNVVINAIEDPQINKKIDRIATALERNEQIDEISFADPEAENDTLLISKEEAKYFKYIERVEERPEQLVGHIRMIDNKTNKGIVMVLEDEKERALEFEVDIKDINLLEQTVSNLALAEANKSRVLFTGEKILQDSKVKKIVVNNVEIVDKELGF